MSMTDRIDWKAAIKKAHNLADQGAVFHRTTHSNVWWVDPAMGGPSTYWVTQHPDGCYSCVERRSPQGRCSHIARVCLEVGATPMISAENPACAGGHVGVIKGYTKQVLPHPHCGCSG